VVAVKAFRQSGDKGALDWGREVGALSVMNSLQNDHIVRFMTAFTRGEYDNLEHYVMFEWADGGNLDNFWDEYSIPSLSVSLMKWVVKQLHGLAQALAAAHFIRYRHGDLKPANILWFRGGGGHGILKLGDWGEAKGHDMATNLRHDTTAKYATRRYEPPETGLQSSRPPGARHARSRLYDIWGLGCITLEFVIWLLYGQSGLKTFNKSNRGNYGDSCMFYELDVAKKTAKVHPVVTRWMDHMAKDPLCQSGQTALGDILDVVRTGLLVVQRSEDGGSILQPDPEQSFDTDDTMPSINITDADITMEPAAMLSSTSYLENGRIQATELAVRLSQFLQREGDERYWHQALEPKPAPRDISGSHLSAPRNDHAPRSTPRPNSAGLSVPITKKMDYEHPSLDPADWSFQLDNVFAADVLSKFVPKEAPPSEVTPKLCDNCRVFCERLSNPTFSISYNTKTLEQNASLRYCDLCFLLWDTYESRSTTRTETVEFQRVGSTLTMSGRNAKNPALLLFQSNGKPAV
jgi:serine/threonine protein kinase